MVQEIGARPKVTTSAQARQDENIKVPPSPAVTGLNDPTPDVEEGNVRKVFHQGEWWFSIIDVVATLVGGDRPRKYWNDLKKNLMTEGFDELSEKIGQLKLRARDGKAYLTDCANAETL